MSSHDTEQIAEAERQKGQDLEAQARHVLDNAQQQADGMRSQARTHMDEYNRLIQKSQQEQQQEAKDLAEEARHDQEKHDKLKNMFT